MSEEPLPDTYWVEEGRLLAGRYPAVSDDAVTQARIQRLLEAGVTYFLDLTEEGELFPYAQWLENCAEHHRYPISDFGIPSKVLMLRILDTLDRVLSAGYTVYLHCHGGIGRTGTVVGCYLVRRGFQGEEALAEIVRLRVKASVQWVPSPETEAQCRMVLGWAAHDDLLDVSSG